MFVLQNLFKRKPKPRIVVGTYRTETIKTGLQNDVHQELLKEFVEARGRAPEAMKGKGVAA